MASVLAGCQAVFTPATLKNPVVFHGSLQLQRLSSGQMPSVVASRLARGFHIRPRGTVGYPASDNCISMTSETRTCGGKEESLATKESSNFNSVNTQEGGNDEASCGPRKSSANQSEGLKLLSSAALVLPALAAESGGYSQASYYTSLGLFILSVPGLWSLIKRSTKSKIVKKTFLVDGPGKSNSKPLNAVAGEITSLLARRNFKVKDRGEVATFEGVMTPNRSQAAFLVFCTALSLASVALVLTITWPEGGDNWYWLTAISPAAGYYYWKNATRTEEMKVKMVIADDEQSADIILQGSDDEVDRLRKELGLMEKGMVYVKGILE